MGMRFNPKNTILTSGVSTIAVWWSYETSTPVCEYSMCSGQVVPSVLLATCEVPHELSTRGYPSLIQASAVFPKKKLKGDDNAHQVGQVSGWGPSLVYLSYLQALPFLEHKLHEQLLAKLRLRGMNAVFRYKLLLSVGDSLIMGTAVRESAL